MTFVFVWKITVARLLDFYMMRVAIWVLLRSKHSVYSCEIKHCKIVEERSYLLEQSIHTYMWVLKAPDIIHNSRTHQNSGQFEVDTFYRLLLVLFEKMLPQMHGEMGLLVFPGFFRFWAGVGGPWIWSPRGRPFCLFTGFFSESYPLLVLRNKNLYPSE